jgi:hypothetical protein
MYYCSVLFIFYVTLPPGIGPIAVGNKYIYYHYFLDWEHLLFLPVILLRHLFWSYYTSATRRTTFIAFFYLFIVFLQSTQDTYRE